MSDDVQRDLGRLEAEVSALKFSMDLMRADLKEIKDAFHEMKGGTRMFMGVAAVLGSMVTIFINWFLGRH
jgi:alpha-ketoglutarate-dependent taurine dioxygenase